MINEPPKGGTSFRITSKKCLLMGNQSKLDDWFLIKKKINKTTQVFVIQLIEFKM